MLYLLSYVWIDITLFVENGLSIIQVDRKGPHPYPLNQPSIVVVATHLEPGCGGGFSSALPGGLPLAVGRGGPLRTGGPSPERRL